MYPANNGQPTRPGDKHAPIPIQDLLTIQMQLVSMT